MWHILITGYVPLLHFLTDLGERPVPAGLILLVVKPVKERALTPEVRFRQVLEG